MKNIIVLTSGLSGSSVVTNLLSKGGYWTGESTSIKIDYNTYENSQLVSLNNTLLQAIKYDKNYEDFVDLEKINAIEKLFSSIDLLPFKDFIMKCNKSGPWIWKDPRLWVTMPFWIQLLKKDSFNVIFVDRSISQRWISELLRKNVQSYSYCRAYNFQIKSIVKQFIEKHQLKSLDILFDDLIERPEGVLDECNQFLESSLALTDLKEIYNKPLYKKARGFKSFLLALLIYVKNYQIRLK